MSTSILLKFVALLVVAFFAFRKARNDWVIAKKNTSNEKKVALRRLRKDTIIGAVLTVIFGAALVASETIEKWTSAKTAAGRHEELRTNRPTFTQLEGAIRRVNTVNTNISKLGTDFSDFVTAFATNNAVDAKRAIAILENSRPVELLSPDDSELETWKADFKNEQSMVQRKELAARLRHKNSLAEQGVAEQERIDRTWRRAAPPYDFIVRTLQTKIQDVAKRKGDKV